MSEIDAVRMYFGPQNLRLFNPSLGPAPLNTGPLWLTR